MINEISQDEYKDTLHEIDDNIEAIGDYFYEIKADNKLIGIMSEIHLFGNSDMLTSVQFVSTIEQRGKGAINMKKIITHRLKEYGYYSGIWNAKVVRLLERYLKEKYTKHTIKCVDFSGENFKVYIETT